MTGRECAVQYRVVRHGAPSLLLGFPPVLCYFLSDEDFGRGVRGE